MKRVLLRGEWKLPSSVANELPNHQRSYPHLTAPPHLQLNKGRHDICIQHADDKWNFSLRSSLKHGHKFSQMKYTFADLANDPLVSECSYARSFLNVATCVLTLAGRIFSTTA